jgi:predicted DNA-binding transcriptional regulator AlpA
MMDAAELARRVPLEAVDDIPAEHLPAVMIYFTALQGRAAARLATVLPAGSNGDAPAALLDVRQAAERLGVSEDWLYRNAPKLPFTRRVGRRALRFDAPGLARWVATRTPRRG